MTPDEMNELTKTARTLANEILTNKLSPRSEAAYAAIVDRCWIRDAEGNTEGFEYPPEPTRRGTYYQYRAAFRRYLAGQVKAILTRADSCQRSGNQEMREAELSSLPEILELLGPTGFGKKFVAHQETERTENRSKRKTLRYFPKDWEEKVFEAATPTWRPAIAVLALAGCRPGELAKGVSVTKNGDSVTFRISGIKTNSGHGQPERTITISRTDLTARFIDALPDEGEVKVNAGSLRTTLNRLSHRLWPKKKATISAYSFRHRAASDVKAAGVAPVVIAATLGHAVTKTQSMYGASAQGSASRGEGITAAGSRPIKDNRRLPPGLREDLAEAEAARPE